MKVRINDAPAQLVRVQVDEQIAYVKREGQNGSRQDGGEDDGIAAILHRLRGDETVFRADGCTIFVRAGADMTELIVVKTIPRRRMSRAG